MGGEWPPHAYLAKTVKTPCPMDRSKVKAFMAPLYQDDNPPADEMKTSGVQNSRSKLGTATPNPSCANCAE